MRDRFGGGRIIAIGFFFRGENASDPASGILALEFQSTMFASVVTFEDNKKKRALQTAGVAPQLVGRGRY